MKKGRIQRSAHTLYLIMGSDLPTFGGSFIVVLRSRGLTGEEGGEGGTRRGVSLNPGCRGKTRGIGVRV